MKFDPSFTPKMFERLSPAQRTSYLNSLPDDHPLMIAGLVLGFSPSDTRERLLSIAARNTSD